MKGHSHCLSREGVGKNTPWLVPLPIFKSLANAFPLVKLTQESEGMGPQVMWSTEVSLQVTEQGRERPVMDLEGGLVEVPIK